MKKVTSLLFAVLMSFTMMAQTPQSFKYQTVARNNAGDILAIENISFRMTLLQNSPGDSKSPGEYTVVYAETHAATTNAAGLATLEIGRGTPVTGSFAAINWSTTPIFLKTETDPAGGTAFVEMGTSELLSVPFALYSQNTANNNDADADPTNELQTIAKNGQTVTLSNGGGSFTDDVNDADANPANELQTLSQNGLEVSLSQSGGTINVADNDNNPANELQQVSKVGNTVTLSQGGGSFTDENTTYSAGSGLQLTGTTFSNTAPDQTVAISAGTGISKSGTYPNFTITNTAPDQTVSITPGTGITKSGTYPNFTIANSMPDQTMTLQGTGDATVSGTYPNFTINADPANELQIVTQTDYNVSLSQGGGSFMTGVKSYTQPQIDALTPYNGLTVHNATTNCINYYFLNNWFEACGTCTPLPTQAAAGSDQNFTDNTVTAILAANTPTQGTGLWTVQTGDGGSFNDATNPAATFTGQPCTSYTLAWAIITSCGTSTDNANVSFFATPTAAFAGNDTVVEGGDVSLYLSSNTPIIGNGLWSVLSGEGGTFADATNPTTLFTGLPEVTYTLQWEITTVCDTSYDEVTVAFYTWQCGSPFTDARDGQSYETVQIGTQCWMAENLNIGTRIAGTSNPTNDSNIEKYCYDNSETNCDIYGGLYQWDEMMNYTTTAGVHGICPAYMHLPSDAEWTTLENYLGAAAGGKMKETGTTHWTAPNTGATNSSGFTALPAGSRFPDGSFSLLGDFDNLWTSTPVNASNALYRYVANTHSNLIGGNLLKSYGFTVRCLKDN